MKKLIFIILLFITTLSFAQTKPFANNQIINYLTYTPDDSNISNGYRQIKLKKGRGYILINYGDGSNSQLIDLNTSDYTLNHRYTSTGQKQIKIINRFENGIEIINNNLISSNFLNLKFLKYFTLTNYTNTAIYLSQLPKLLIFLRLQGGNISGNLSDLPRNLTNLYIYSINSISGNLSDLPRNLSYLILSYCNNISGNLSDLPRNYLIYFLLDGCNNISGNLSDLPNNLNYLIISFNNNITGYLSNLPTNLIYLQLVNCNNISGNLSYLPTNLIYLAIYNSNIYGNITSIPNCNNIVLKFKNRNYIDTTLYNIYNTTTKNGGVFWAENVYNLNTLGLMYRDSLILRKNWSVTINY